MNIRKTSALATLGLCALVGVVAYRIGRARADGVPTTSPLYYGGVLDDGGSPVEGMRNVTIRLWDMATGGTAACTTVAPNTPFSAGRFRVEMDAACTAAVRANPDLWAEVLVDSTTFARTKLGAVPYALEAGRAAGASGPLEGRIAAVEALARPRQVVIGSGGGSAMFAGPGTSTDVVISSTAVTFTPTATGTFSVSAHCTVSGQAELSMRVVSSPMPSGLISRSSTANTFIRYYNSGTEYSTGTTSVVVETLGSFTSGTSYTVQLAGTLYSLSYGSSTARYTTTNVQCDRVIAAQLN